MRDSLLLIVTFSLCGQFAPALGAQKPDGPEVVIGSTRKDFGDVFAGEELEQNFPVFNNGKKPLELAQRSTLGSRSAPGYPATAMVWRSKDQPVTRTVAAWRPAPS